MNANFLFETEKETNIIHMLPLFALSLIGVMLLNIWNSQILILELSAIDFFIMVPFVFFYFGIFIAPMYLFDMPVYASIAWVILFFGMFYVPFIQMAFTVFLTFFSIHLLCLINDLWGQKHGGKTRKKRKT